MKEILEELIQPIHRGERQAVASMGAREETVMVTLLAPAEEPPACRIIGRGIVSWKGLRVGTGLLGPDAEITDAADVAGFVIEEALTILGQNRASLIRVSGRGVPE